MFGRCNIFVVAGCQCKEALNKFAALVPFLQLQWFDATLSVLPLKKGVFYWYKMLEMSFCKIDNRILHIEVYFGSKILNL